MTAQPDVPGYKIFEGSSIEQMPLLRAAGRVPASAAWIMRACLAGNLSLDTYHDSGDAVVNHPDGMVKLVHASPLLYAISQESRLSNGALVLPDGGYEEMDAVELSPAQVKQYAGHRLSLPSVAVDHPVWQFFADGDKDLLEKYASKIFGEVKRRYDLEAMGIYVASPQKVPTMHLWCLRGVANDYGRGNAYGYNDLGSSNGRLVGVVAPGVRGQSIDDVVSDARK